MRTWEGYLAYLIFGGILLVDGIPTFLGIAILAVLSVHMVTEKPRWQLIFLYVLAYTLTLMGWPSTLGQRVVAALLAGLSCLFACILPVAVLPSPRGKYGVARTMMQVGEEGGVAGFQGVVYYPTLQGTTKGPYLRYGYAIASTFGSYLSLPSFVMTHLTLIENNVFTDQAPLIEQDKFPLIIFSHGLHGNPDNYLVLIQHFVSNGFIVIAIEHGDGSGLLARVVRNNQLVDLHHDFITKVELADPALEYKKRNGQLQVRVRETQRLLDVLFANGVNNTTTKAAAIISKIDKSKIAVMGHSFGAATAVASASVDSRLKTAVAFDTWMMPLKSFAPPKQPIFFHEGETYFNEKKLIFEPLMALFHQCHSDSHFVTLPGSAHLNYCDFAWFASFVLKKLKLLGQRDRNSVIDSVSDEALCFIQQQFDIQPRNSLDHLLARDAVMIHK